MAELVNAQFPTPPNGRGFISASPTESANDSYMQKYEYSEILIDSEHPKNEYNTIV